MTLPRFDRTLAAHGLGELRRGSATTVQVNVTTRCNLACHHCHVESGPKRTEAMDRRTFERVLELVDASRGIGCLDFTGGAPEMWEHFRWGVAAGRERGLEVIDRCNLTIFYEPGYEDLPQFLADRDVRIVASLPCYTRENVDQQRGRHVFDESVEALRWLNRLGYGRDPRRQLDLVYNPVGPVLPPPQAALHADYQRELRDQLGIEFNRLLTITNMPIKRWADLLRRRGEYDRYLSLLVTSFNPDTAKGLMCRDLVSIGYDGRIYDCDFNQQLELPPAAGARTVWELASFDGLEGGAVATGEHCYGCTAGSGSSCGGALT